MASPEEVANFLNGTIEAPTLTPLRPFWDTVQNPWNHHLAELFANDFMEHYSADITTTHEEVSEYFLQRLETLRKNLSKRIPRGEETREEICARVAQEDAIRRTLTRRRGRVERVSTAHMKHVRNIYLSFITVFRCPSQNLPRWDQQRYEHSLGNPFCHGRFSGEGWAKFR